MHHIDAFWLYHVGITPGCIFFIKMKPEELVENESLAFPKLSFRSCKAALWGKCLMLSFSQGKNFLPCVMKADPVQCGWQTLRCAGLKDCGFSVCIFAVPPLWPSQVSLLLSWKACSFVTKDTAQNKTEQSLGLHKAANPSGISEILEETELPGNQSNISLSAKLFLPSPLRAVLQQEGAEQDQPRSVQVLCPGNPAGTSLQAARADEVTAGWRELSQHWWDLWPYQNGLDIVKHLCVRFRSHPHR